MITLTLLGILKPDQALQGFASNGVMTIAALYIVVAGPARNRRHGVDLALGARPAALAARWRRAS